jgi:hypothetical protein
MKLRSLASTNHTFYTDTPPSTEIRLHSTFCSLSEYTYPPLQSSTATNPLITTQLQWLPDASALITASSDVGIRTYIPPESLLEEPVNQLISYTRAYLTSITTSAVHPSASLYNGSIPLAIGGKEIPLKLYNAFPDENGKARPLRVYNTAHPQTEKYAKISSLAFLGGSTILSGSMKSIQLFDIERSDPIGEVTTTGIVSAMAPSRSEFIHDGWFTSTWNGHISLHSLEGDVTMQYRTNNGVFQVLESINGKYLYVIPRQGDSIDVLDIRMGLEKVCDLLGFKSQSQRISGSLKPHSGGLVIGTSDGCVMEYRDAEMAMGTSEEVKVCDTSISHVSIHPQDENIIALSTGDRACNTPEVSMMLIEGDDSTNTI